MTQTVVGVFDTRDTAYAAGDALIDQGVDQSSIYLSAKKGTKGAGETGQSMEAIRRFLDDLFGPENAQDADHYAKEIERGSVLLSADLGDDVDVEPICEALEEAGAMDLEVQRTEEGQTESRGAEESQEEGGTLPVIEETLDVGKKARKGKVRVVSRVVETPVQKDVTLREEYATIKRRRVDEPINPDEAAMTEESIEIEEMSEQPVVSKKARVVEEVEVSKETGEKVQTVEDTVRRTEVDVEREPETKPGRKGGKK